MDMSMEIHDKNELINTLTELASKSEYVYRGYSYYNEMMPRLIKNNDVNIEMDLLREFEKYSAQYMNVHNSIDFLSNAQHFGLSTRLLDFTYIPYIALYFALYKKNHQELRGMKAYITILDTAILTIKCFLRIYLC